MNLQLTAPHQPLTAGIALPQSKSITNRALVIAALCGSACHVIKPALCDDTDAIAQALSRHADGGTVDVGPAGTAMRFLTAYYATRPGATVTLDGNERMRRRPIAPLVDALRSMGACIDYKGEEGFPPLHITGTKMRGRDIDMDGSVSSQFISAVMMILPAIGGGALHLAGDIVSAPYIDMTAAVMTAMGASVDVTSNLIVVGNRYAGGSITVEADWSAAAPWYALACLMRPARYTLQGLTPNSIQGDSQLAQLAARLGIATRFTPEGAVLDGSGFVGCCCSSFADMTATPDLAMNWAVLLCLLERSFRMTGVRTLRHKESDRIQALREGLAQLGYVLKIEGEDTVSWHGERCIVTRQPPVIDTRGDHRVALAFAPAAVRHPGLIITDADVVNKSYPAFWKQLAEAGFSVKATH